MKKTHLLTLAACAAVAFVAPVHAADMSMPFKAPPMMAPAPSWTGFYIGVNGGYGWSHGSATETPFQNFALALPGGGTVVPGASLGQSVNGALFGVHGGYNWQTSAWVWGVEGDFDASGMGNSSQIVMPDPLLGSGGLATDGLTVQQQVQWLASARARLGYTWGSSMLYVTGGGAWESLRTKSMLSTDTSAGVFSQSGTASNTSTRSGYAVGVGYEWMISNNWIARTEYLHYGFTGANTFADSVTCTVVAGGACGGNILSKTNNIDAVRAALSYKF
jgi:outer membrane immunogenic protein